MKYDPIKELNDENTARLLNPFKILLWGMILAPVGIALVIRYGVAIDSFALRHPVITGLSLIAISVTGLVLMIKKMLW